MSNQIDCLREFGHKLQDSPTISIVLMGKFVVDCANRLALLESDRRVLQMQMKKTLLLLNQGCALTSEGLKLTGCDPEPAGEGGLT